METGTVEQNEYKIARAFKCNKGQDVVRLISDKRSGSDTISDTINLNNIKIIKMDKDTGAGINNVKFELYNGKNCNSSKKIKDGSTTTIEKINGILILDKLKPNTQYSIKEVSTPNGYKENNSCHNIKTSKTNGDATTEQVYNEKKPVKGGFIINKKDENKNLIKIYINGAIPAKFNLFSNSNCTGNALKTIEVPIKTGTVTVSNLNVGGYSIKETQAPAGYVADTNCHKVNITANSTSTINITNKSECFADLEKTNKKDKSALITLYKKYNKNGLLNFSNPSCTVINCGDDKSDSSISCLSASKNSSTTNFNENNLSCYESALQDLTGNYIGFCRNSFTLSNKLGKTSFTAKSGRFLIKGQIVSSAASLRTCYILKEKYDLNQNIGSQSNIEVYFGDNNSDGRADKLISTSSNSETTKEIGGFNKVTKSTNYDFNLNKVYLEKITGKVLSNKSNKVIEEQGLIIPFNSPKKGFIPFKVVYGDETSKSTCPYTSEKEIIKYPTSNPEGKLDLEFRVIDTLNPFPGKKWNNKKYWK